ncbi:MAG: glutamyl-tRNA amidotransferase [Bacteroidetes bacterium QH_2_64_74]|nr:MAG: glutamyl-tRNA amidotransferase [Bacteroidetes bacterium QH_2_64_74]
MSDSILDRVKEDLTQAMKDQDEVRRRTLRSLRAALANKEIEQREEGTESTLGTQEELAVVQKQVKQRRDSIEQYEEAGRDDLVQKEREEIEVLEDYLPDRLSDEELAERIDAIIEEVGATSMADMGPVMGRAMEKLRGRVDGNRVRKRVQNALSNG